jgi:hypothetical protein
VITTHYIKLCYYLSAVCVIHKAFCYYVIYYQWDCQIFVGLLWKCNFIVLMWNSNAAWLQVLACIVIFYLYCLFLCLIINNGFGQKHYFWAMCMKWLKCIHIGVRICERKYHNTCICRSISVLISDHSSSIYLLWQPCQVGYFHNTK